MNCEDLDKRTKAYKQCLENNKGLGDIVESITEKTGIKKVVKAISKAVGVDCGCEKRKEVLNKIEFNINTRHKPVRCFTPDRLKSYGEFIERRVPKTWERYQVDYLVEMYNHIFAVDYRRTFQSCMDCNGKQVQNIQNNLDKVYNEQINE